MSEVSLQYEQPRGAQPRFASGNSKFRKQCEGGLQTL